MTAVDHAMTEGDDRLALEQRASGLNDLARGGAVVEALRAQGPFLDDGALVVGDLKPRRDADSFDLSAEKAALVLGRLVDGEFDA